MQKTKQALRLIRLAVRFKLKVSGNRNSSLVTTLDNTFLMYDINDSISVQAIHKAAGPPGVDEK